MLCHMNEIPGIVVERIDDIPLLLAMMEKMQLAETLDKHLGNHGHQQGMSNGWVATVWLAFILSEGKHTKMHVQEWVENRRHLLSELCGQTFRRENFSDDRLALVLRRLSDLEKWHGIEHELWTFAAVVHEVALNGVRLDSTTSFGYHTVHEEGLMQHGHSKDQRPDLPQLKLMLAVAEPAGEPLACDVHSGENADDPLYLPLMARVRAIVGRRKLLYTGDAKMAALAIRGDLVAHGDNYLTVLPRTGATAQAWEAWLRPIVDGEQTATLVWREEELLGAGYEFVRSQEGTGTAGQELVWAERVQLVRSHALARTETQRLHKRLEEATTVLHALTPPPGRGRRQFTDAAILQVAVEEVLSRFRVQGLLQVDTVKEEKQSTRYVGPGRGGPNRLTRTETQARYRISAVNEDTEAIARHQDRLGWRAYVTNLPNTSWSLTDSVVHYRAGHVVEQDFHNLKDRPLGLSPLYVHRSDQIVGMTHLLTLALRVLLLLQNKLRQALEQDGQTLTGLYESQPGRATDRPTGQRILRTFARAELTRVGMHVEGQRHWQLTPLSPLIIQILALLRVPIHVYYQLGNSP
jgi:transposase